MQVKNILLPNIVEFLHGMKLSGKASIGRSKIKEEANKHFEEYSKDQLTIIDEFDAWTDKENGQYTPSTELNETLEELHAQEIEIKVVTPFKKDFVEALENYDEEVSGQQAEAFAVLYENYVKENE